LARGYLNRTDLTAEKFVADPFCAGGRLYRTGDLARRLRDGRIEFVGRMDDQVKIRGFRVELGEIESVLRQHPEVGAAAVIARTLNGDAEKNLCAYYVPRNGGMEAEALRDYLHGRLPGYMTPAYFVKLDAMPLTENGKVDRGALPDPDPAQGRGRYVAPRNETEERLAGVFSEVLGVEKVGIDDNFFELGGHSLRAVRAVAEAKKKLEVELELKELFAQPTVRGLAELMEGRRRLQYEAIPRAEKREHYPVSSAQRRMYALQQLDGGTAYNVPGAYAVRGDLEPGKVEDAIRAVIGRHEALRTRFELRNGKVVQRVEAAVDFRVEYREEPGAQAKELMREFVRPFDLGQAPLLRVMVVKRGKGDHVLCMDLHHIVSDLTSGGVLLRDFARAYGGGELKPLAVQYKDYSEWQRQRLEGELGRRQKEYWLRQFAGEVPVLELATDYPRPPVQSFAGERRSFRLEGGLRGRVARCCEEQGVTMFMALLAAYQVLLSRYSGQEDIVVGTPVTGRDHPDLEEVLGPFINTLALRSAPERKKRIGEFLQEVKEQVVRGLEHQGYPFEELVETVEAERDLSRNPLFSTLFAVVDEEAHTEPLGEFEVRGAGFESTIAKFDLTLIVRTGEGEMTVTLEYATRLFKPATIERMAGHYERAICEMLKAPQRRIGEIELLAEQEKEQLLREFNATTADEREDRCIHELFEEQARLRPEAVAVTCEGEELTYGQLNARANQLARRLRQAGAKADSLIGLLVDRSLEMIVGLLGILKAGAAYVPIDPEYPRDRIEHILADSGCGILFADLRHAVGLSYAGTVLAAEDPALDEEATADLPQINGADNLAYVIYTSGSTGQPKGVMIGHRSLVNYARWAAQAYLNDRECFALCTSLAFDLTVTSIYTPLITGKKVKIFPRTEGGTEILRMLEDPEVDVAKLTPSHLQLASLADCGRGKIALFVVGGEDFNAGLAGEVHRIYEGRAALFNEYGPTEATVGCMKYRFDPGDERSSVLIGKPGQNSRLYILDRNARLAPVGVPGELCIAGEGVARGYWHRPDLTAERFSANPFEAGGRMYRTGDAARWLADGNVEFLGRLDDQVKIRGHRVELGEVEAALQGHPEITAAAAAALADEKGDQQLIAYIVPRRWTGASGSAEERLPLGASQLRGYLEGRLPGYMVPSCFVRLEALPLTPNGKVDRKRLPEPEVRQLKWEYVGPRDEVEEKLARVFAEALGVEKVGIEDNFFELGGHSLRAIRAVAQAKKELEVELELKELFAQPTVRGLAEIVRGRKEVKYQAISRVEGREWYPVSSAQRRMYAHSFLTLPLSNCPSSEGGSVTTSILPSSMSRYSPSSENPSPRSCTCNSPPPQSVVNISDTDASKPSDANCSTRPPTPTPNIFPCSRARFVTPPCSTITPFGWPVDPDV